jgi:transaldolase
MALFIDSSDPQEIKSLFGLGVLTGVTTNPLIIAREAPHADLGERIRAVLAVSSGDVSVELTSETEREMLEEAAIYHSWDPTRIAIKVPMTEMGLRVVRHLSMKDVKTNMTCIMSMNQAYLAALAGATYVSIFSGRVRDMGYDVRPIIRGTRDILDRERSSARIIVGSIRHVMDVNEALECGCHVPTISPAILRQMIHNVRTEQTIEEFNRAWRERPGARPQSGLRCVP